MKIKFLRIVAACGLWPLAFFLSACPKNGIVILPVNGAEQKHFEDKWTQIELILKKHPELYYIQDYSKGSLVGDHAGSLPEILLEREPADVANLADAKFTGHAFQIGVGLSKAKTDVRYLGKDEQSSDNQSTPNATHAHNLPPTATHVHHYLLNEKIQESAELVKEVDNVLNSP